jgi:hypothetical protein
MSITDATSSAEARAAGSLPASILRAVGHDQVQSGDPRDDGGEQAKTRRVGPLQVVDEHEEFARGVDESCDGLHDQRPAALGVDRVVRCPGHERRPRQGLRQGSGQGPGLVPVGPEGSDRHGSSGCCELGEQTGLAGSGPSRDRDHSARSSQMGGDCRERGVPSDEPEPSEGRHVHGQELGVKGRRCWRRVQAELVREHASVGVEPSERTGRVAVRRQRVNQ